MAHETSDFGWPAGYWPSVFDFAGIMWYRGKRLADHGEFWGYEYTSDAGELMTVFND